MIVTPNYYHQFHCIAGACRHTCCAGWEVEIDEETLEKYKRDHIGGILETEEGASFVLTEGERCPHLTNENLCRLILEHGEDYLCQICTDHPRFRNFWTGVTELGLGLVCEEAARIILTSDVPVKVEIPEEAYRELPGDEKELWDLRQEMMEAAGKIEDPMAARLREYLIFRHIPDALYDDRLKGRIGFIDHCFREITGKWKAAEEASIEEKLEIARAFSYDVEYDEEVKEELIDRFEFESEVSCTD